MAIPDDEPAPSEHHNQLSRGQIVVLGAFSDAFVASFHDVAYVTPRYPDGIKKSDLTQADQNVQHETALWWFHLNFEQYDLSKGGPYFGFAESLKDTGAEAP